MSDTEALDLSSFPLVNPGKPTSLRRSHSVVSLPTPPTTIRKRPRSRASSCYDSEEEGDAVGLADDVLAESRESPEPQQPKQQPDKPQPPARKRRRVDPPPPRPTATADEEEFWGPARPVLDEPKPRPRGREQERAPSITASASRAAAAITLPSPPPTRPREPVTPPPRRAVTPPPRTEKGKDKTARPVRDSPHNPFLESPAAAAATAASTSASPVGPKTPLAEPPTLTYVFRGKKQIFVNPAYNAPRDPRADLPETHPEYSPGERVEPRKLFTNMIRRSPTGHGKAPLTKTPPRRKRSASPERDVWDSDSDADEGDALPMPMLVPSARLADKLAHAVADDGSDDEADKSGKRAIVDSDDEELEPKKAPTSLHASAAIREKVVIKASREGSEKAISKVHAAVDVQDKGRATASRRRDGEPRLVLAPTRAPTAKQSSFSPAQLDGVEEEAEEEDESEHEEESVEHTAEDPWALPPAF